MFLFVQDVLGRNRQEFSVNSAEDLEPIYKMFPITRHIESDNFVDLLEMIAETVSNHFLDAWVVRDNTLPKINEMITEDDEIHTPFNPEMISATQAEDKVLFEDKLNNWYDTRNTPKLPARDFVEKMPNCKPDDKEPITDRDKLREAITGAKKGIAK